VAAFADFIVAGLLIGLLDWIGLVLYAAIVTVGHAWRGQSPGKLLFGIEVRRDDGSPLGFGRALLRTVASLWMPILEGATIALTSGVLELLDVIESLQPAHLADVQSLLIAIAISQGFLTLLYVAGLAIALFHPRHKAIHDLVVRSVVTYRLRTEKRPPRTPEGSARSDTSGPLEKLGKKLSTHPPPR
jgi:uncharacterized RDD family membrane protein YckC